MFFLFKRNKLIYEKIMQFLDLTTEIFDNFEKGIKHYIKNGLDGKFNYFMDTTNKYESSADDVLDDITIKLYKKSLLPEAREDILVLLNNVDDIADKANHILSYIYTHNILLPDFLHDDLKELLKLSVKTHELVVKAVKDLFSKRGTIIEYTRDIDNFESICDSLQFKMTKKIFDSKVKDFEKILLRDFIDQMARVSDLCEESAHVVTLLNIKRIV